MVCIEYEEKERGNDWFWALGVIILASAITSFIYTNYFFGLFLIIGGILLGTFAVKKPDLVFYELNEKGLKIRNRLYSYNNIKAFLGKKRNRKINPLYKIRKSVYANNLHAYRFKPHRRNRTYYAFKNVPEEEMKEHVSEKIMDFLGF